MKRYVFSILIFFLVFCLASCGKKRETLQAEQEPLSIEVSPMPTSSSQEASLENAMVISQSDKNIAIPLPPQGPYKPTSQQIQIALKNAGYYNGKIDGKIGPLTKKAISEFQAANNLEVDGKVGRKTWAILINYLNPKTREPLSE